MNHPKKQSTWIHVNYPSLGVWVVAKVVGRPKKIEDARIYIYNICCKKSDLQKGYVGLKLFLEYYREITEEEVGLALLRLV